MSDAPSKVDAGTPEIEGTLSVSPSNKGKDVKDDVESGLGSVPEVSESGENVPEVTDGSDDIDIIQEGHGSNVVVATNDASEESGTNGDEDDADNDDESETDASRKNQKKVINPNFKDVRETGKWGNISKKEMYVVLGLVAAIVIAIIVVVTVLLTRPSDSSSDGSGLGVTNTTNTTQITPTIDEGPKFSNKQDKYEALRTILGSNQHTVYYMRDLPETVDELEKLPTDSVDPVVLAVKWAIFDDDVNIVSYLSDRFAMASVFFALGGENWNDKEGWLSDQHICKWDRVGCQGVTKFRLEELEFSRNNLVGTIPSTVALLNDVYSLWLNDNKIQGEIPGDILGSLPRLHFLYLQDNEFVGKIPVSIMDSGTVGKFHIMIVIFFAVL